MNRSLLEWLVTHSHVILHHIAPYAFLQTYDTYVCSQRRPNGSQGNRFGTNRKIIESSPVHEEQVVSIKDQKLRDAENERAGGAVQARKIAWIWGMIRGKRRMRIGKRNTMLRSAYSIALRNISVLFCAAVGIVLACANIMKNPQPTLYKFYIENTNLFNTISIKRVSSKCHHHPCPYLHRYHCYNPEALLHRRHSLGCFQTAYL